MTTISESTMKKYRELSATKIDWLTSYNIDDSVVVNIHKTRIDGELAQLMEA